MGWRSLHHEMVEVDLVEDGPADLDTGPVAADRHLPSDPPGLVGRLSHRVGMAACATVLVVTALVVNQVRHVDPPVGALAGAGVSSLAVPLQETWRLATSSGWSVAADVLLTTERQADGIEVHAYDLTSGRQRWGRSFSGEDTAEVRCPTAVQGPGGSEVVCQALGFDRPAGQRYGAARTSGRLLLLSELDGAVAGELPLGPDHLGFAAVDGDLVLATAADGSADVTRIAVGTGSSRWRVEVPWDGPARPRPDGAATAITVEGGLVVVAGPTTTILDARDGHQLGHWTGASQGHRRPGRAWVVTVPHGFGVRTDATARYAPTTWYTPDGHAVGQVEGTVFEPEVSDGSVPEVVLVATTGWGNLRAVDVGAGTALWSVDLDGGLPAVRAGGAVVLAGDGGLRSVDLRTGDELWRTSGEGLSQVQPVSDGRVVLVTGTILGVGSTVSAISIRDGRLVWRAPMPAGGQGLRAAGGAVVAVGPGVVIGLG